MGRDVPHEASPGPATTPTVVVPEVREYTRINAEVARLLDLGATRVRLAGVEGQRLLLAGLAGPWSATVVVEGRAGPELAAGMDAPGLTVVCHGDALDGAGSNLKSGRLWVLGDAGDAVGYAQAGGAIVVAGAAGHRAGLNMNDGVLILSGAVGRLAGERQAGGRIFVKEGHAGPHLGHGRRGGRLVVLTMPLPDDPADLDSHRAALRGMEEWRVGPWPGSAAGVRME
ncbi:MAG TPA: glutamate synthase [Isosphaeraceae bacterium]|jgi:glutamate synthase domain-containing protein 3|nr:glutamate synthase [Isosphaeraceae bacterium]